MQSSKFISLALSRDELTPAIKISRDIFCAKNDDLSSDSSEISAQDSPRKEMQKNISILNDMGFGTSLTSTNFPLS